MRRLVLKMSMTLDGYVAGPEGEMDWAARTSHPDGKAWVGQTLEEAGAHVIGRRLFAQFVGYWPTSADPLAEAMNSIPKIVFSRSSDPDLPSAPGWEDPRVLGADLAGDIEALKAEPGKDLLAQGGVSFGRSLVQSGLVDEYRLVVHPVVLGSGLPLFDGAEPFDLDLVDAVKFPSGSQALTYRPK
ncbi:MAG TPA: dihydrofolate reductase family protein [Solirubrobacterales bacterium]|nr:dihydrofolate reductase family protein [Solirubrobacterales bacterium]